jgi:hypothetical protein
MPRDPGVRSAALEDPMTRRLLETLSGTGAIHAGDRLLRMAHYQLSVWANEESAGAGEDPTANPRVDGHIDITGIQEAVVLAGPDSLVLTIEDGRRLAFHLTSSGGGIAGHRWLPRA